MSLPGLVTGEGAPFQPQVLLWMGEDGMVLGSRACGPGELPGVACESLQSTIEKPILGRSHAPTRIRVAMPELADALRAGYPAIEILCAPTPEIDTLGALMRENILEDFLSEPSYLAPGVEPDTVASFFRAAAALFRAKPWKVIPTDDCLVSVTIEALGIRDAPMSIIGQVRQSFGFVLFADFEHFIDFRAAADAIEHGEEPEIPPHFSLSFERAKGIPEKMLEEIAEHRWEIAGRNAHPWLVAVDEVMMAAVDEGMMTAGAEGMMAAVDEGMMAAVDGRMMAAVDGGMMAAVDEGTMERPLTTKDYTLAEAIALALPHLLAEKKAIRSAWTGGDPVSRTVTVSTHGGEIEVTLRAPHEGLFAQIVPTGDVLGALAQMDERAQDDIEVEPMERQAIEDELVRRFAESPEAADLEEIQACRFVMEYAADYLDATIATLNASGLREIVFEIIPRKVSIDASEARWIIEECRAFYAFLKRECSLPQADACLRVLGGDAVEKLHAALSDSRNFGMAKSLFMAGREAGYDMDTEAGIERWMRKVQDDGLPPSVRLPPWLGPPPSSATKAAAKAAAKTKKNKRKTARKARKRNR